MNKDEQNRNSILLAAWSTFSSITSDMIFLKDQKQEYIAVSESFARDYCGKTTAEILGRKADALFPSALAMKYADEDQAVLKSGQPLHNRVAAAPSLPGQRRWVSVSKHPVTDAKGQVIGLIGVLRDITERLQPNLTGAAEQTDEDMDRKRYRIALMNDYVTMWDYDYKTRTVMMNKDISEDGEQIVHTDIPESNIRAGFVDTNYVDAYREMYRRLAEGAEKYEGIFRIKRSPAQPFRYERIQYYNLFDADGTPVQAIGMAEDITERYEAQQAYDREMKLQQIMAPDMLANALLDITDWTVVRAQFTTEQARVFYEKDTIDGYFGAIAASVVDREDVRSYFHTLTYRKALSYFRAGKRNISFEYQRKLPGGEIHWVCNEARYMTDPNSGHLMMFICLRDIDKGKREVAELKRAAERDSMTGLYNRAATIEHIAAALRMNGKKKNVAVFMVDVDDFKHINDTLGHIAGDEVISSVAKTIRSVFRPTDIVGRMGGDEFMILMDQVRGVEDVEQKARQLVSALQYTCKIGQMSTEVSGSVGISLSTGENDTVDTLYALADAALYRAKAIGKRCYAMASSKEQIRIEPVVTQSPAYSAHLHTLLENMHGGIVIFEVGAQCRIVYASTGIVNVLEKGAQGVGLHGEGLFSIVYKEDAELLENALRTAMAEKSRLDIAFRVVSEGKKIAWRQAQGICLDADDNGPGHLIAMISDITNIKEAEEQLRSAELRYRTAVELNEITTWEFNYQTSQFQLNGKLAQLCGVTENTSWDSPEILQEMGCISPESVPEYRQLCYDLFSGNVSREYDLALIDCKGNKIPTRNFYRLFRTKSGAPQIAVGVVAPLLDSTQELNLYRAMAKEGVFSVRLDEGFSLLFGNDRCCAMVGYSRSEMANQFENKCVQLIVPEDQKRVQEVVSRVLHENRSDISLTLWLNTGFGTRREMLIHGRIIRSENGGYDRINCVLLDITEENETKRMLTANREESTRRYQNLLQERQWVDQNAVGSLWFNLTKNTCERGNAAFPNMERLASQKTIDAFLAVEKEVNTDPVLAEGFCKRFGRQALLDAYAVGETNVSFDHRLLLAPGRDEWVRTWIQMSRNPETGDIEGLIYAQSIQQEKMIQAIMNRFLKLNYEFIVLVDVHTGMASVIHQHSDTILATGELKAYEKACRELFEGHMNRKELNDCLERISLPTVQAALARQDCYTVTFSYQAGQTVRQKRLQYTYLDDRTDMITFAFNDVTDLYLMETDPATGIYNAMKFRSATRQLLLRNPGTRFVMVRFDLDHFKAFNDLYGGREGDRLLSIIGSSIRMLSIENMTYCRISGDHFALCLPEENLHLLPSVKKCVQKLKQNYPDFDFSLRCGIYRIDDPGLEISQMCDRALLAMRLIKYKYGRYAVWYDDTMRQTMLREQELGGEITRALEQRELCIYLQPQYDQMRGTLVSAEALVRWQHPTKGFLSPAAFIPYCEENGLIIRLDNYVFESVCQLIRSWMDSGLKTVPISVNLSRQNLYDTQLCERLIGMVRAYGLSPEQIHLELTESAYIKNSTQMIEAVKALQKLNFVVEMDDFGSGFSSLNILKEVPFDIIKLDMAFLSQLQDNNRSGIILNAMMRMAHWLKIPVIAEGVEKKAQADFLKSIGCSLVQGYYFDRPIPVSEFMKRMAHCEIGVFDKKRLMQGLSYQELWNPESELSAFFNQALGAAGIFEFHDGELETLKASEKLLERLQLKADEWSDALDHWIANLSAADHRALIDRIEEAIRTGQETTLLLKSIKLPTRTEAAPLRIQLRMIGSSMARALLLAVMDVPETQCAEKENA